MTGALHVQAGVWENHGGSHAVLCMEGEAPDPTNGGGVIADALYRVALACGLRHTTDLDNLDLRPTPGWSITVDRGGALTLEWPQFRPLFEHVPVELPDGWLTVADGDEFVLVFVGYGLGEHPISNLQHAAEVGALAAGVVPVNP